MGRNNRRFKLLVRFCLAAIAIALIGLISWKGLGYYRFKRQQSAFRLAGEALARGDFTSARFWAMRLLQIAPGEADTARLLADLEELQGFPEVLNWRARAAHLGSENPENFYAWAKSAMAAGDTDTALYALQKVPLGAQKDSVPFHELMAGWAAAMHQFELADFHFAEAVRIEPNNPAHAINLATLRLQSANLEVAGNARTELEKFAKQPAAELLALRALLADAVRRNEKDRMGGLRDRLISVPNRTLGDELLCLHVIMGSGAFPSELARIESETSGKNMNIVQVADWMIARGLAAEALRWLNTQPGPVRDLLRVQMATADAYLAAADMNGLAKFLVAKNWRHLDFIRRAMLLRVERETGQPTYASEWRQLARSLKQSGEYSLLLGQLVGGWKWNEEAAGLYWSAAGKGYPARKGALRNLWTLYTATGDTNGMLRVAENYFQDAPNDVTAKNNYAFLSLLLGVNQSSASRFAREASESFPKLPGAVCTYAYSLYLAGKYTESLSAMQSLSEKQLASPGIALYYALVLQANGQREAALRYASVVVPDRLLSEEKVLLSRLQAGLTNRSQ